jgi:hypothetical protein
VFLIIAFGVLAFGVYVVVERRKSLAELRAMESAMESEKVVVDEEGWEKKASEDEGEGWGAKPPDKDEGWEAKDEDPTS